MTKLDFDMQLRAVVNDSAFYNNPILFDALEKMFCAGLGELAIQIAKNASENKQLRWLNMAMLAAINARFAYNIENWDTWDEGISYTKQNKAIDLAFVLFESDNAEDMLDELHGLFSGDLLESLHQEIEKSPMIYGFNQGQYTHNTKASNSSPKVKVNEALGDMLQIIQENIISNACDLRKHAFA